MRLKQRHHSPSRRPRRRQRSLDLSWMMAVIIDDQHAVSLALDLEPSLGPAKLGEHPGDLFEIDSQIEPDCHRRQSVLNVVSPRYCELDPAHLLTERTNRKLRPEARIQMNARRRHVRLSRRSVADRTTRELRYDRLHVLIVEAQHYRPVERHAVGEFDETLLDLLDASGEMIEMIAVDVGQYRNRRREQQQ